MIYMVQAGIDGPVKIGYTTASRLKGRLAQLQTANHIQLTILRTIHGAGRRHEAYLHDYFQEYKIRGEWFLFVQEMMTIVPPRVLSPADRKQKWSPDEICRSAKTAQRQDPDNFVGAMVVGDRFQYDRFDKFYKDLSLIKDLKLDFPDRRFHTKWNRTSNTGFIARMT